MVKLISLVSDIIGENSLAEIKVGHTKEIDIKALQKGTGFQGFAC